MSTSPSPLHDKLLFPFIAPPNGGKGTQTKVLSEKYDLPTFDMGATFRKILKTEGESALAKEIKQYMDAGKLVPIATVMKVFPKGFEELARQHQTVKGFILDGFPRDMDQAKALIDLCRDWGAEIAKVVYLNVPDQVVTERSTGRRFCTQGAHRIYNVSPSAPEAYKPRNKKLDPVTGSEMLDAKGNVIWLCDEDGAELELRADDEPAKVQERLTSFAQDTQPVINLFRQRGELAEINGNQPPEDVTQEMLAQIDKKDEIDSDKKSALGLSRTP